MAIFTDTFEESIARMRAAGYDDWTFDEVTADARFHSKFDYNDSYNDDEFRAKLAFNYDIIPGMEFELIQPLSTNSYTEMLMTADGGIAHMGVHLHGGPGVPILEGIPDSEQPAPPKEQIKYIKGQFGLSRPIQQCVTFHHASTKVPDHRRYRYIIWESVLFPWPIKTIERIDPQQDNGLFEHV